MNKVRGRPVKDTLEDTKLHKDLPRLMKHLDTVFINYVRKKHSLYDRPSCFVTGERRKITLMYLFNVEDFPNARWDERNALPIADKYAEMFFTGKDPLTVIRLWEKYLGKEEFDDLEKVARSKAKYLTTTTVVGLINEYARKIEEML